MFDTSRLKIPALAVLAAAILSACGGDDVPSTPIAAPAASAPMVSKAEVAEPAEMTEKEEKAKFFKVAPADKILLEKGEYDTELRASIALKDVNEASSVKRHIFKLNGREIPYVARAGHLIASRWKVEGKSSKSEPEAAIFYTSYTRDALPKEKRPVTFLWNGGPGSSSIWLHMASWGPKRLKSDAPNITDPNAQPRYFPFEDNAISLLDHSDIVFVDPPGTGLSTAIAPFTNQNFWGTDVDAQVIADFITAYINKYDRQSSPKYLYGESYGGIRTPIVANLLTQAGTAQYAKDPSGKPAKVLSGFILNSPLVDYMSNCGMVNTSCSSFIPSYAMTADYYKKSKKRGSKTQDEYLVELRTLAKNYERLTVLHKSDWADFEKTDDGIEALGELSDYTGIKEQVLGRHHNLNPGEFRVELNEGYELGRYDARMKVFAKPNSKFEADQYIDVAFGNQMRDYLPNFLNYRGSALYIPYNDVSIHKWAWTRAGFKEPYPQSVTDIQAVLTANPKAKLLVLHGYEDVATPGFQTELDLARVNLSESVPVKWFEGGHMIYNTEVSRGPLKKAMDAYYKGVDKATPSDVGSENPAMQ